MAVPHGCQHKKKLVHLNRHLHNAHRNCPCEKAQDSSGQRAVLQTTFKLMTHDSCSPIRILPPMKPISKLCLTVPSHSSLVCSKWFFLSLAFAEFPFLKTTMLPPSLSSVLCICTSILAAESQPGNSALLSEFQCATLKLYRMITASCSTQQSQHCYHKVCWLFTDTLQTPSHLLPAHSRISLTTTITQAFSTSLEYFGKFQL